MLCPVCKSLAVAYRDPVLHGVTRYDALCGTSAMDGDWPNARARIWLTAKCYIAVCRIYTQPIEETKGVQS